MEIRIDSAYGKVFIKEEGEDFFTFFASFYALGIDGKMSGNKIKEIVKQAYLDN